MKKHIIIFSHGFGVRKTNRGLFTDIMNTLQGVESYMFDLNEIVDDNTLIIRTLPEQAEALDRVIQNTIKEHPDATIDLVCHSQGGVVAALCSPDKIRKTILIAPPITFDIGRTTTRFQEREGTEINLQGISKLARADGSTTLVPSEYWTSLTQVVPLELYNNLAQKTELTIITALQDEVLERRSIQGVSDSVKINELPGNHNFDGVARKQLVDTVKSILTD